jgi:hypothetical protein
MYNYYTKERDSLENDIERKRRPSMKKKVKPRWGKPKLIIISRGQPGERVLGGCKTDSESRSSMFQPAFDADCTYGGDCADLTVESIGTS